MKSEDDYFRKKEKILKRLYTFVKSNSILKKIKLNLNTLDMRGRGVGGTYLTVLGTSADGADSGQVGRGNRPNGVIPLNRHTGSEAAAGKNPVSHVGKIYNLLTHRIANEIYSQVSGLDEVYVWIVSQIGKSIDEPAIAAARVITKPGTKIDDIREQIAEVVDAELEHIDKFCMKLAEGKIPIC
ncbi:S-adenosylmethionine synthase [subsurface metagenome]